MDNKKSNIIRTIQLPVLPLRGSVLFPGMALHFDVGRHKSLHSLNEAMMHDQLVFLVAQKDMSIDNPKENELYRMGVVARVRQVLKLPNDVVRVAADGLYRAKLTGVEHIEPYILGNMRECVTVSAAKNQLMRQAMLRQCKQVFDTYFSYSPPVLDSDMDKNVASADDIGHLTDYIAYYSTFDPDDKQKLLETLSLKKRVEMLILLLEKEIAVLALEQNIHDRVHEQMNQNQRDYYLREQLKVISQELGEGDNPQDEAGDYRGRIAKLGLQYDSEEKLLAECDRLEKMPPGSHEATVIRGYIEACLALPWNVFTHDKIELTDAKRVLDKEHYGMEKVKDRILELLAVRKLAPDIKGQIICLAGPPGVGKTSIARSVAEAMGRKYVRISLGGTRDESDIRGHRRTYIGAMAGRIINAIKQAGSSNPVILLDEIDKMGNDFRGDPSAAMLEVLDSEQNHAFRDHYIELPYNLSQVLFITTANDVGNIPRPLYDRMEIISLSSYTADEKFHIAKNHLLKRQIRRHGMTLRQLRIDDEAIRLIIDGYTRESGVRELERCITKLCRKSVRKLVENDIKSIRVKPEMLNDILGPRKFREDTTSGDEVGLVNGLAWTSVGGEVMPIEVAVLDGSGKIELTGSLGDVMKESARTAVSYVRSRAREWNIDAEFHKNKDIHIHALEGAVPKDGPSAGVAIATAMISALTGIPISHNIAMTGEISLRGRVLPIGGLREKSMAAYRHRIKTVVIPAENESDLAEVDLVVKENVRFVTAETLDTVIDCALVGSPKSGNLLSKSKPVVSDLPVVKGSAPVARQ